MNYLILTAGTVIIVIFSWFYSVRHKRYHGIPRLFSFESIFILLFLNLGIWLKDPFSSLQILSWILLILSAYTGLAGFFALKRKGKAVKNFENTTVLVRSGIYQYIRHPLYLSLLLLGTGVMVKDPGLIQLILGAVNLAAVYLTAKTEEKEMIEKFGDEYAEYMHDSKLFIPFVF